MEEKKCAVINLFAGPGVGKSILSSMIFTKLKMKQVECEQSLEYVKDKVYEESKKTIENQIYLFGKQQHKLFRLRDKVKVIVADGPLPISLVYDESKSVNLKNIIMEEFNKYNNFNIFVKRNENVAFEQYGRSQKVEEARLIDERVLTILKENNIPYYTITGVDEPDLDKLIARFLMEL
jgi:hypothetical protein